MIDNLFIFWKITKLWCFFNFIVIILFFIFFISFFLFFYVKIKRFLIVNKIKKSNIFLYEEIKLKEKSKEYNLIKDYFNKQENYLFSIVFIWLLIYFLLFVPFNFNLELFIFMSKTSIWFLLSLFFISLILLIIFEIWNKILEIFVFNEIENRILSWYLNNNIIKIQKILEKKISYYENLLNIFIFKKNKIKNNYELKKIITILKLYQKVFFN